MSSRPEQIEARLVEAFEPVRLQIKDQSHLHAGHAGARDGKGHFDLRIVSPKFAGMSQIQRHRQVYQALGSLMETDIHALKIQARTPDED
ncbi:MAG: BolA family transcriptional regulator [Woeseiaceae bacterium]|nr:BolA family transcriptional regulator [Woeseiaceae bacterium]